MRLSSVLLSVVLSVTFVACHSDKGKVSASPRFHEEPKKFGAINLTYVDTNSVQWKQTVKRLDSFYSAQVKGGFNGAVLIGYHGSVLYERYYGVANRETGAMWNTSTSSQLASTSKTFTSAAILYLHAHKYLNIDDPVQTYLKVFPYPNITVRMLLCHRSGLPDYTHWVGKYMKNTKTPINNNDLLRLMATYRPKVEFAANTRFTYSNTNYAVLASVIEAVTEIPYKEFMQKYIFDPLGMQHTFVFDATADYPTYAAMSYKYNWVKEPLMFADGIVGDKNIYSTTEDMYRWDQSFYQNTLLDNETLEVAYGPCSFERPGVKNYGLGWRMLCYPDGYKVIYHNGWWHGNNTCFYRFIKDNFTIIVLGNKYNSNIYRQPPVIYSIVNGTSANDFEGEE